MDLFYYFGPDISATQEQILVYFRLQPKIIGKTRFQKLMFLYEKEILEDVAFEYTAYKYGPYSESLSSALDELIELGMIKEQISNYSNPGYTNPSEFEITSEGMELANRLLENLNPINRNKVEDFIVQYGYMEMQSILELVYEEYPEFTTESLIRDQVLNYN